MSSLFAPSSPLHEQFLSKLRNLSPTDKMQALTYDGVGKWKVVEKEIPKIQEGTDAIVKLVRTTICGTDLHILKGDVPTVEKGRTLGHEGIGVITETGAELKNFKKGWILGHTHDGTQAEYVRIRYADSSLFAVPEGVDERSLLVFSDILPTGLEVGTLRGKVTPGCTVAIVGAGPVGLAAGITAQLYAPRKLVFFDMDDYRLEVARKIGATHTYNVRDVSDIRSLASEHEAVGLPTTFQMCQDLVGLGGHIANMGVHGQPVDLQIHRLWSRSISISMALVSAHTIPTLLDLAVAGKVDGGLMVTH
ncbi:related to zinc-binding oxidoreductase, partial [Lecanosticta acicola]